MIVAINYQPPREWNLGDVIITITIVRPLYVY